MIRLDRDQAGRLAKTLAANPKVETVEIDVDGRGRMSIYAVETVERRRPLRLTRKPRAAKKTQGGADLAGDLARQAAEAGDLVHA